MTPNNSREVSLSLGRDRLARAMSRLDRLTRDASETIAHLRDEKQQLERMLDEQAVSFEAERESLRASYRELETRFAEAARNFEQERSNFEQRAVLLQSVLSESEERTRSFDELTARHHDLEAIAAEQLETIARLQATASEKEIALGHSSTSEAQLLAELEEWKGRAQQSQDAIEKVTAEKDQFKSQLYEKERQDAQWALKLSEDDRKKAATALEHLFAQLSQLETRVLAEQPAQQEPVAEQVTKAA